MKIVKEIEQTIFSLGTFYSNWYSDLLAKIYVFFSLIFNLIIGYFIYTETNQITVSENCPDLKFFNNFLFYTNIFMFIKSYLIFKFNKTFKKEDFTQGLIFNWQINTFLCFVAISWFINVFTSIYQHEHCLHLQYLGCISILIDLLSWLFHLYLIKKFVEYDKLFSNKVKYN